ncbi:MAG TPA: oxygen-independent coproporphyrinogen III oxidase [Candidatus Hydrogenedentes bacterium]|nr:oxygen-independent coproporphyrinogen III oxidase [Candidatus Hydrogenedentota bacterium]HOS02814.1 oxygen-independent coproporphyrinogen III oxidase [Candidatus Hydrogenedentota bacterium]
MTPSETTARMPDIEVTRELLEKYDRPGPRYTSYPTAPVWREDFRDAQCREALAAAATNDDPLSLYVHVPFCRERCAFCGCNVVITRKEDVMDRYIAYVGKEAAMAATALGKRRTVKQLHWGGGTPTSLQPAQMRRLFTAIADAFELHPDAEIAIEVDPRVTTREQVDVLREIGFNRVSMGVQDLDADVQHAIGRGQSEAQTRRLFDWCREAGFEGINIDLVYGLPMQRIETWRRTIERAIDIRPDRLAVYSYAHLPDKMHNQRRIDASALPMGADKFSLFAEARRLFLAASYRAIGMDHFALPHDELAHALDERRLHRNFMGYTVAPASDMLGFGVSAIGEIGGCYAQNEKKLSRYYAALDENRFATAHGIALTDDDKVRRWVIRRLMCDFRLEFAELTSRFGVTFDDYFAPEIPSVQAFAAEGFLARTAQGIDVLPLGRAFIRNVCMAFDAYLKRPDAPGGFSRTV